MEQRRVGRSGLTASVMGLGCNNFGMRLDQDESRAVVEASLDSGVSLFDTADIYSQGVSERYLGAALGARREDVLVASKFGGRTGEGNYASGASRRYVIKACEASLRRLNTDYIDLYYQHYPDPETPIEETLGALDDLVRQGKVRYIGSSNFPAWQVTAAHFTAVGARTAQFIASQVEWSLLEREVENEHVPACLSAGVGIMPYFPLGSGVLSGKYHQGEEPPPDSRLATLPYFREKFGFGSEDQLAIAERLGAFAEERGYSLLELALRWIATRAGVSSVLVGATSPSQVKANANAVTADVADSDLADLSGLV